MLHVAFSTIACPTWTLRQAASQARAWDFDAIELRTFGPGSTHLASDPCLSDPSKVRETLRGAGVELAGYATGARFDDPIFPPLPLGFIFGDLERPVRELKPVVQHASLAGAPTLRVFANDLPHDEARPSVVKRIADRLKLVCDDARHQNVRIALENGGAFPRAEDLADLLERVDSPLLGVCYNLAAASAAGEDTQAAVRELGNALISVRLSDFRGETPCVIGTGDVPCEPFVRAIDAGERPVQVIIEWPVMWRPDIAPAEDALPASFAAVTSWTGYAQPVRASSDASGSTSSW